MLKATDRFPLGPRSRTVRTAMPHYGMGREDPICPAASRPTRPAPRLSAHRGARPGKRPLACPPIATRVCYIGSGLTAISVSDPIAIRQWVTTAGLLLAAEASSRGGSSIDRASR
jgi:hypothetical protein